MKLKNIFWVLWFIVLTIGFLLIPTNIVKDNLGLFALLLSPAWLVMLFKLLYDNVDRIYFEANRLWLILTNATTHIDFAAEFGVADGRTALANARGTMSKHAVTAKPRVETPTQTVYKFEGYTVFLSRQTDVSGALIGDTRQDLLLFEITEFAPHFRETERLFRNQIFPLLAKIQEAVSSENQKYVMKLRFENGNPYFGLYVRQLHLTQIENFNIHLRETMPQGQIQTVEVSKEKVMLVTDSLAGLNALADKYFTLAAAPS